MIRQDEKSITMQAFAKLGNEKLLHEYCISLYNMMGLVVDFVSAEEETLRLSRGSNFNRFCSAVRNTEKGTRDCHACDLVHAQKAARDKETICYRCHAGLYDVIVPLFDRRDRYLGCLTSGQFHLSSEKKLTSKQLNDLAAVYGLDPAALQTAYEGSPVLTQQQLDGVIGYLEIIGRHLTGLRENLIFLEKVNIPGKIESIRKYAEENYTKKLIIREVARKFYVSVSFLSHNFKREMNVSFIDYVNAFRVNKAKEFLSDTRLQISEIAMMTGFGSISQFNRVFRTEVGVSAKKYRLEHGLENKKETNEP